MGSSSFRNSRTAWLPLVLCLSLALAAATQEGCESNIWAYLRSQEDLSTALLVLQRFPATALPSNFIEGTRTVLVGDNKAFENAGHSTDGSGFPATELLTLTLFNTLPEPLSAQDLSAKRTHSTELSKTLSKTAFNLLTAAKNNTQGGPVVCLPSGSCAKILRSTKVCNSWFHVLDALLIPDLSQSDPSPTEMLQTATGLELTMQHQGEVAIMRRAARKLLASATMPLAQSPAPIVALFGVLVAAVCMVAVAASFLGCFWPDAARPLAPAESEEEGSATEDEDYVIDEEEVPYQRNSLDQFFVSLRHKLGGGRLKTLAGPPGADGLRQSGPSTGSTSASSCIPHGPRYSMEQNGTPRGFIPSARLAEQMRMQSASCESLDDAEGTAASIASLRSMNSSWEMNSWELNPDEVQVCLDSRNRPWQLGCGGFGRVFRAEMAGSTPVAVKFVSRQSPRELKRFVHEIGILKSLRHTNIVQFLGAFIEVGQMVLVTEYMAGGDLYDVMGHDLQRDFSWYKRGQQVALDVVRGVVHMHARKIIHLDLKSANILLTRDGTAKIADVGLAKVLSREITQVSVESTFDWAAPEVLAGQTCSEKADIWSLGVVLWEIVSGEAPKLRQLRPLSVPEECPEAVRDVIVACRASDPAARPSARDVFDKLSAAAGLGVSPRPPSRLSGMQPRSRPTWAPPEHPRGEEVPSSTAALHVSFAEAQSVAPSPRHGRAAGLPPRPMGGAHQHAAPPPWVRSERDMQLAYFRASSL